MDGILPVDKPKGLTSHEVVERIRKVLGGQKVGHCGTLDPLATGLLVLCLGEATKASRYLEEAEKEYEASLLLGVTTDTQDVEGHRIHEADPSAMSLEDVQREASTLKGSIYQLPPLFSAVKYKGKPLYFYARKGLSTPRKERLVFIKELTIERFEPPEVHFRVVCSKGTYVRTLCHDLGHALGCGACMKSLRRKRVGPFCLAQASTLEELHSPDEIHKRLIPLTRALPWPKVILDKEEEKARLMQGSAVTLPDSLVDIKEGDWALAIDQEEKPLALVRLDRRDGKLLLSPKRVFGGT